jgi:hypothetical protein
MGRLALEKAHSNELRLDSATLAWLRVRVPFIRLERARLTVPPTHLDAHNRFDLRSIEAVVYENIG